MAKTTNNSKEGKEKKEKEKEKEKKLSNSTNTPHDEFFGKLLKNKEAAIAFFKRFLSQHIIARGDFSKLTIWDSKHVTLGGKLYNDIIYRLPLDRGQIAYILLMCEHQSTPHPQMPFRLLKYNIATMEEHLEQKDKYLPVIVNMVFYHGRRPWNYSTALADYYKDRELGVQYLDMAPFILVQLPASRDDELYRDKDLGFGFAAFRCTSRPDPYQELSYFLNIPLFKEYFENLSEDQRQMMVSYLGKCITRKGHSLEKLINLTTNNTKEKKEMMETIAQEYIDKGIEQGMELGKQEGMQAKEIEIAKNMLLSGLSVALICQVTGLSKQAIAKLSRL